MKRDPSADPERGEASFAMTAAAERPRLDPGRAALREALGSLRKEIRSQLDARRSTPELLGVDWMRIYEMLRTRVNTLGIRERFDEVDEFGLDVEVVRRAQPWLDWLADRWWHVEVQGLDAIPLERPLLFVANRSGLLPWDGLMIAHVVARRHPRGERPRFLVADWLATRPFAQPFLARLGGVRACRENAERLLSRGTSVVAFPEGVKGAAKPFRERYRVKRFGRGGAVRTALAARVPLVPVAVVGAEEVHPVLFRIETTARWLGLPFVPVTPTFPWFGPLGLVPLPSKWSVRFGAPLETDELGPGAELDELLVWRLTEQLRATIQHMLEQELRRRPSVWKAATQAER